MNLKEECLKLIELWEKEMNNEDAEEEIKDVFDHCRCQLFEAIEKCDE